MQTRDFEGLAFVNLVDFDMLYGHRRDVAGYAAAATEFDRFLADFIPGMREGDLLMITADHGCDPSYTKTTDHTREYVPDLVSGKGVKPGDGSGHQAVLRHHRPDHLRISGCGRFQPGRPERAAGDFEDKASQSRDSVTRGLFFVQGLEQYSQSRKTNTHARCVQSLRRAQELIWF